MRAARSHHRHEQLLVSLRRLGGRAAAVSVLIAGTVLAAGGHAPAATGPVISTGATVQPSRAVAADLTQFTVSGTAPTDTKPGDEQPQILLDGVTTTFNGAGAAAVGGTSVRPSADGTESAFTASFAVPAGTVRCEANTIALTLAFSVEEDDGRLHLENADGGSVTITAFCPSITVSPPVVGNQQLPVTYTVTPSGFPSGDGSSLTVDGTPTPSVTDDSGNVEFTASPSCGTRTATLSQPLGEETAAASAQFRVLCPAITLKPASFPLAQEPQQVQVTGTQFHPDQPVQITLDGTPAGTTVTSRAGGFGVPITAAGLDCGAHKVTATEQPGAEGGPSFLFSASATLQVTNCVLRLTLPPAVVGGEAAHVTGTGFAPGVPVTLTWKLPGASGAALPGTLRVTPDSGGRIDGHFLIIPPGRLGPRQCVATQGKLKLTAGTVVTLWPAQPSPAGQLVYRG